MTKLIQCLHTFLSVCSLFFIQMDCTSACSILVNTSCIFLCRTSASSVSLLQRAKAEANFEHASLNNILSTVSCWQRTCAQTDLHLTQNWVRVRSISIINPRIIFCRINWSVIVTSRHWLNALTCWIPAWITTMSDASIETVIRYDAPGIKPLCDQLDLRATAEH